MNKPFFLTAMASIIALSLTGCQVYDKNHMEAVKTMGDYKAKATAKRGALPSNDENKKAYADAKEAVDKWIAAKSKQADNKKNLPFGSVSLDITSISQDTTTPITSFLALPTSRRAAAASSTELEMARAILKALWDYNQESRSNSAEELKAELKHLSWDDWR
jgi:hypothetical protein